MGELPISTRRLPRVVCALVGLSILVGWPLGSDPLTRCFGAVVLVLALTPLRSRRGRGRGSAGQYTGDGSGDDDDRDSINSGDRSVRNRMQLLVWSMFAVFFLVMLVIAIVIPHAFGSANRPLTLAWVVVLLVCSAGVAWQTYKAR